MKAKYLKMVIAIGLMKIRLNIPTITSIFIVFIITSNNTTNIRPKPISLFYKSYERKPSKICPLA